MTKKARVTVIYNGVVVQLNQEVYGTTPHAAIGTYAGIKPTGPISLMGHHKPGEVPQRLDPQAEPDASEGEINRDRIIWAFRNIGMIVFSLAVVYEPRSDSIIPTLAPSD